jgi:hypothetical protein
MTAGEDRRHRGASFTSWMFAHPDAEIELLLSVDGREVHVPTEETQRRIDRDLGPRDPVRDARSGVAPDPSYLRRMPKGAFVLCERRHREEA